jgi:hypothetical protein
MQKLTIIFLIFLLAGCSTPVPTPVSPVTPTVTAEMLPTQTSTATATVQPANTLVPSATNTPTTAPEWIHYQCLDILPNLPNNETLNDVRVYGLKTGGAYLDYGPTAPTIKLPKQEGGGLLFLQVSPDRKYILYRQGGANAMYLIADAKGQLVWSTPAPEVTKLYLHWFDEQRLIEWKVNSPALPDIALVNPFSRERVELPTDFPYFIFDEVNYWVSYPHAWGISYLVFNSTLTQVIYPELVNYEDGFPVTLWDLETNQPVVKVIAQDTFGGKPIWIHNGEQFLIGIRTNLDNPLFANEFFLVSQEGEIRQLTHFTDVLHTVEIDHDYRISPDERMVAFWITAQPGPFEDDRLAVLDLETGLVTNYCIPGGPFANNVALDNSESPIWSPDSTQMLVVNRDPENTAIRRVILVDVAEGWAAQIATEIEPIGWMVSP